MMSCSCLLPLVLLVVAVLCCCWASPSDDFYYPYVRFQSEPVLVSAGGSSNSKLYGPEHDYSDYSRHYTRSDQSGRNSGAQPPPSGPYFAHELKSYYHNNKYSNYSPHQPPSPWNSIHDTIANEYQNINHLPPQASFRPGQRPFPLEETFYVHPQQPQPQKPLRKPISKKPIRKKQKKRPPPPSSPVNAIQQQQHPSQDKVADAIGAQSIASAYPNGVMGTLSLMAGLVWYLVNKSATPVVKMRQSSSSGSGRTASGEEDDSMTADAVQQLMDYWMSSLKESDCQLRAICELVSESPVAIKNFIQSIDNAAATVENEDSFLQSNKAALLFKAVSNGEQGVDCSAFYPNCNLPFRLEPRDRRRRRR